MHLVLPPGKIKVGVSIVFREQLSVSERKQQVLFTHWRLVFDGDPDVTGVDACPIGRRSSDRTWKTHFIPWTHNFATNHNEAWKYSGPEFS
jgi:hypothetical protein